MRLTDALDRLLVVDPLTLEGSEIALLDQAHVDLVALGENGGQMRLLRDQHRRARLQLAELHEPRKRCLVAAALRREPLLVRQESRLSRGRAHVAGRRAYGRRPA